MVSALICFFVKDAQAEVDTDMEQCKLILMC